MACSGGYCSYNNTGTSTCVGHRPANSGTPVTIGGIYIGGVILSSDITTLRNAIANELALWNNWNNNNGVGTYGTATIGTAAVQQGQLIAASHVRNLNDSLSQIQDYERYPGPPANNSIYNNGAWPGGNAGQGSVAVNTQVQAAQWNAILTSYNVITQDCICNSDCHCNAVCACNNDCGCNYSDERLKRNIKWLETINGINLYEFNYTWDQTKKYVGVLAQELLNTIWERALSKDRGGEFYQVDYSKLPVQLKEVM